MAKCFGTPIEYPFVNGIEGFPEIIEVAKLEHERINFGGIWHSDTTYLPEPPMGTLLVAREVPPVGGDTLFANQYLAYESLSERMREMLDGLTGVSSSAKADVSRTREDRVNTAGTRRAREALIAEHPVVRTHPRDRPQGAVRQHRAHAHFAGMTEEESAGLLAVPVPPSDPPGVHLPLPLGRRFAGVLGQSLRAALPDQRLSRLSDG